MSTYIQHFLTDPNSIKNVEELSDVVQGFYRNCPDQAAPITQLVKEKTKSLKDKIIKKTREIIFGAKTVNESIKTIKEYKTDVIVYKLIMYIFSTKAGLTAFNINEFDNNLRLFERKLSLINKKVDISGTKSLLVNQIVSRYLQTIQINVKLLETNLTVIDNINKNTNLLKLKEYFKHIHVFLSLKISKKCPAYDLRSGQNIESERMLDEDCILLHLFNSEIEKIYTFLKSNTRGVNNSLLQKKKQHRNLKCFLNKLII